MGSWIKPGVGFLKVNVASEFDRDARKTGVGCIVKDSRGRFMKGSGGMIGLAPPVVSDLWALFYGLKLAWEMDVGGAKRRFVLETTSSTAVHAVLNPDPNFPFAALVDMINMLLHEAWDTLELTLIADDANKAANKLAHHSLDGDGGVDVFDNVPAAVQQIINNEA